jgi:hypothetical protein
MTGIERDDEEIVAQQCQHQQHGQEQTVDAKEPYVDEEVANFIVKLILNIRNYGIAGNVQIISFRGEQQCFLFFSMNRTLPRRFNSSETFLPGRNEFVSIMS